MPSGAAGDNPRWEDLKVDDVRTKALATDSVFREWTRATEKCRAKALGYERQGEMAAAQVWRHLLTVAANAREQRFISWKRQRGLL